MKELFSWLTIPRDSVRQGVLLIIQTLAQNDTDSLLPHIPSIANLLQSCLQPKVPQSIQLEALETEFYLMQNLPSSPAIIAGFQQLTPLALGVCIDVSY